MKSLFILLSFILVLFANDRDFFVTKSGDTIVPHSICNATVYEDFFDSVRYTTGADFFENNSRPVHYIAKQEIDKVIYQHDTVSFTGNLDSRIDTTQTLETSNFIPEDGAYLSLTQLKYNAPSYFPSRHAFKRTNFSPDRTQNLKVPYYQFEKEYQTEEFIAYARKGKLYWGSKDFMTPMKLHKSYSWTEISIEYLGDKRDKAIASIAMAAVNTVFSNSGSSYSNGGFRVNLLNSNNVSLSISPQFSYVEPISTKGKTLLALNMKTGKTIVINRRNLRRLLEFHNSELEEEYKKARDKKEYATIKEYFLKLITYLDEQEKSTQ